MSIEIIPETEVRAEIVDAELDEDELDIPYYYYDWHLTEEDLMGQGKDLDFVQKGEIGRK